MPGNRKTSRQKWLHTMHKFSPHTLISHFQLDRINFIYI
ncbi:Hypothetical protein ETEE_2567 [Edwardsiella anguillarum ET080813]|uniref:Uncharacterized protein n=1 Tax=Edwardsiella anguillarum ET080813 TaxID=667120 RepID=A0A076LTW1_9GAMM|nr:Hypothetical protein ETEE_2567 [Edwardsiella anguillarum ET080813]